MKRLLLLAGILVCASALYAQTIPYNVVFDLTSKDTNDHKSVIRWINGISSNHPDAKMEVVLYGQSLDMVTKDKSAVTDDLQKLASNKNVAFKVCGSAMKRHNLDKSQLLPGVDVVPDGIYEILQRQKEGWGYIKAAR
jgi:uncharacterized protein